MVAMSPAPARSTSVFQVACGSTNCTIWPQRPPVSAMAVAAIATMGTSARAAAANATAAQGVIAMWRRLCGRPAVKSAMRLAAAGAAALRISCRTCRS